MRVVVQEVAIEMFDDNSYTWYNFKKKKKNQLKGILKKM